MHKFLEFQSNQVRGPWVHTHEAGSAQMEDIMGLGCGALRRLQKEVILVPIRSLACEEGKEHMWGKKRGLTKWEGRVCESRFSVY